ncbi:cysteine desulfurase family protein [Oryzobacter telluris]|uniref:cysteine desulfurase family protein n=1 Tax=Oryzobacter telluris TaxID=3149179 RepID=UPI00370D84A9
MTHYLDHAATTPMLPAAVEALVEQAAKVGNASSLHTSGRAARAVVEESRERIAAVLGARPSEVVFTSGGTEADNLAVKGTHAARRTADPARTRLVVSAIEHHAVLDPVEHLVEHEGASVTWLEPDRCGHVSVDDLRAVLAARADDVALVSVMWANNEVGTVQPVAELAAVAHEHGIPFHTDGVQAVAHLPVRFDESGADLMTVSGHKVGGPLGVGALLARRDARLVPLAHGGGQERQVRSGTLDVPAIRSLAVALEATVGARDVETKRVMTLRDRLCEGALALGLGISVSGCWTAGDAARRLAGNAHLLVPGCEGDSLLYLLDAAGVECSTGSACQAGVPQPSHVLLAMGYPEAEARGALRLSLGHTSTDADVDAVLAALPGVVERARRAGGFR